MRGISTGWNTSKPYCSGITPLLSFPSLSLPPSLPFLSFISNIYRAAFNCHGARQMSVTLTETLSLEFFH